MKDKRARLFAIRRLIRGSRVRSQEELLDRLKGEGFDITQATLSRDLRLLKVSKVPDSGSGYTYTIAEEEFVRASERNYVHDLLRGWLSIEFSGDIGVVKTLPGHADSVAIALDNLGINELLGTVAGDDTIIVILKDGCARDSFLRSFSRRVPEIGSELG